MAETPELILSTEGSTDLPHEDSTIGMSSEDLDRGYPLDLAAESHVVTARGLLTTGTHITGSEHCGHTPADELAPALSFEDLTAGSYTDFTGIEQAYEVDSENLMERPTPSPPPQRVALLPFLLVAEEYPDDLLNGLSEISQYCVYKNFVTADTMLEAENVERIAVRFQYDEQLNPGSVNVRPSHMNHRQLPPDEKFAIVVSYKRKSEAFRALGRMLGVLFDIREPSDLATVMSWDETAQFQTLGVMIDCSRSAVLTMQTVMYLLRTCALLGMNTFQLYTEDTYQIEDEPFFGYLRGGFSQEDRALIDNYASNFGIEVFPCIQTLGHLGQILQWPRFAGVRDTHEVILPGSEETYQLIEKMVDAASKPLQSKRIHIGMDEAHGVGEGRYKQIFGEKDSSEVFLAHLQRVEKICKDRGLKPMVWSDMLFTLAAKNNSLQSYYETSDLPQEMKHNMPDDLDLVYWDYYHVQTDAYSRKIQQHRDLGFDPWVAGGIWSWNRFYSALPFTFAASDACLKACKRDKVKNVFVTTWGDDGNECDILSALPGFVYYSEHCYTANEDIDWSLFRRNFAGICGGNLDDWIYASKIDLPLETIDRTRFPPNVSKWLLWNDPFYGFFSPQYAGVDLGLHYQEIAQHLATVSSGEQLLLYPLNERLAFPARIADVLRLKANLRQGLVAAYKSQNPKKELYEFVQGPVRELRRAVDRLWKHHRDQIWLSTYRPFGLEIIELRYGGLRTRLETLEDRILAFCGVESDVFQTARATVGMGGSTRADLSELDAELREVYAGIGLEIVVDFARAYTPSRALGTG
ncbi:uncharacterized protein SPPG_02708 [Spizellomyces punctatus DAOM BR117]|uniref:beta-N-acetylhexosaminidase n=1 Tax=Spizellomyces punctatus (strain DAOM BR117) TaxID=645134 RepID=A0A0L0HLB5_SPIPD|nr:uncharacterized protein SPPG_02708 [Spizellomyces punctatus DAOM BR117]KND02226.1 hypothetical protein SPPG_02708 [Spizellomyces punctatus DAOM BR117]|eukprot:XP_016610265.1 hypothetical protein SPPG_02708 [Spizellomyces punctatus DAOM BR117]